jgi:hypothetical protein
LLFTYSLPPSFVILLIILIPFERIFGLVHTFPTMPSITQIFGAAVALATVASALPAQPKLNERAARLYALSRRQAEASPALTDVDILQL